MAPLTNIVEDLTPQLGGDLDVNGKIITSAGNADVRIQPAGTGGIELLAGNKTGNAGTREIWLATSGGGQILIETLSNNNTGDIFVQSGGDLFLETFNFGFLGIDSAGFMNIKANKRIILESVTSTVDIKAALGVNFFDPILGEIGSASAPSFGFKGDTDTGFYRAGANTLGLAAAGQKIVTVSGKLPMGNQVLKGMGIDGNLTITGTVTADAGFFADSLTVAGIPVANSVHTHDVSDVVTGTFVDGRISQSSVVQHQSAFDHDSISGLGDDDHPQYVLVDGSRAFTSTVGGVDPVATTDLVTKNYVDNQIITLRNELLTVSGSLQAEINTLQVQVEELINPTHNESLDLTLGEKLRKDSNVDIGIGNVWTLSFWVKPDDLSANFKIVDIDDGAPGTGNDITLNWQAISRMNLFVTDDNNVSLKRYRYNDFFSVPNVWYMVTITWDGTNLKLYRDGLEIAPSEKQTDDSITMVSINRKIALFSDILSNETLEGLGYSGAIWNVALSTVALTEIYNSGDGRFDLSIDSGNYTNSSNLFHWWKLGINANHIGKDYGNHTTLINVMDDAVGIDATDIVNDFPGM